MAIKIIATLCVFLLIGTLYAGNPREQDRAIEMAKWAIAIEVLNAADEHGRYACSMLNYACVGPNRAEMGLSMLDGMRTKASAKSLLEIGAFNIDAGLSEQYSCALINNRVGIKSLLPVASAKESRKKCIALFLEIKERTRLYKELDASSLCRSEEQISRNYVEFSKLIRESCDGE